MSPKNQGGVQFPEGWTCTSLVFYKALPAVEGAEPPALWVRRRRNPENGLTQWRAELELPSGRTIVEYTEDLDEAFLLADELAERELGL